jgi:hypothetical protein
VRGCAGTIRSRQKLVGAGFFESLRTRHHECCHRINVTGKLHLILSIMPYSLIACIRIIAHVRMAVMVGLIEPFSETSLGRPHSSMTKTDIPLCKAYNLIFTTKFFSSGCKYCMSYSPSNSPKRRLRCRESSKPLSAGGSTTLTFDAPWSRAPNQSHLRHLHDDT